MSRVVYPEVELEFDEEGNPIKPERISQEAWDLAVSLLAWIEKALEKE